MSGQLPHIKGTYNLLKLYASTITISHSQQDIDFLHVETRGQKDENDVIDGLVQTEQTRV